MLGHKSARGHAVGHDRWLSGASVSVAKEARSRTTTNANEILPCYKKKRSPNMGGANRNL
jgi:hypothetical protein